MHSILYMLVSVTREVGRRNDAQDQSTGLYSRCFAPEEALCKRNIKNTFLYLRHVYQSFTFSLNITDTSSKKRQTQFRKLPD